MNVLGLMAAGLAAALFFKRESFVSVFSKRYVIYITKKKDKVVTLSPVPLPTKMKERLTEHLKNSLEESAVLRIEVDSKRKKVLSVLYTPPNGTARKSREFKEKIESLLTTV